MSWTIGRQKPIKQEDFNSIVKELAHDFEDDEARILLARFLRHNIGFTYHLISGKRLLPIQEIALRGLFLKDNGLFVAGRGVGKSFIISVYCCLYPIFYPNTKLCLISTNFRNARNLFDESEKMIRGKDAGLLAACFPNDPKRGNDKIFWKLPNGSEFFALPLSNGEGLRGTRASTVLVDEGLLISEEIQKNIIRPFLTARQNYAEESKMREIEDELISRGEITEEDRTSFQCNKYLVFSSASYQFQYLYKMFNEYCENIQNPIIEIPEGESKPIRQPSYFVMRASYEALPSESFVDRSAILAAQKSGGENSEYFKREYRAMFSAGNDGYFNVKKLHECTIPDGQEPTVQLRGNRESKYILAIDPSYSKAMNSDHFAMAVYMLLPEKREVMLVHSYGKAGGVLSDHYTYLSYILTHFNIVYTIIDASGTEFIDSFNNSTIAKERNLKIGMFDNINFDKDDYLNQIQQAKRQYNLSNRNFVYPQLFSSDTNRRMNEYLQAGIDASKVWFASRLCANDNAFQGELNAPLAYTFNKSDNTPYSMSELMEEQDRWIVETKSEMALIEVKSTVNGILQYDLPRAVKKNDGDDKARRDNYTCCLLAYYASKHYFDMIFTPEEKVHHTFTPFCI